jgi:CubicO group peptidase (beta-lactamase class C family)
MIRLGSMPTQTLIDNFAEGIPILMEEATVPGLAITLIREGSIVWSQAFGVRDWATQEPVTRDTLFEAASLSKPLFAYASLKLCEKGALDLDTPLVEYIPDDYLSIALPTADSSREQLVLEKSQLELVTARHVLSHTAGFPNWPSKDQPLKRHFVPGERFAYSGTGFAILQSIVEIITNQSSVEYTQENILEPFGLKNSRFVWTGQENLPVALGHNEKGEPTEKALWPEMIAGASLHSTPTDFAKFMLAVMQPSADNPYHLSSVLTKEMLTPQVKVNDSATWHEDWPKPEIKLNEFVSWGLGWGMQHTATGDSFWHWGDNGNYQNFAIGSRQKGLGVVIMTNGKHGQQVYQGILGEIMGGEYPALDWLKNL